MVLVRAGTRESLPNPTQWPDLKGSGGIFFETCSHDYDLVRWLCRSEVSRVEAEGSARSQPDQHTVITNLYLANGVVAQVDASRMASYGYDVRAEVMGTKGIIFTRPDAARDFRVLVKGQQEPVEMHAGYADRFADAYRLELESFVRSIIKDEETLATAADGRAAAEIAAAAKKSMQEGKAVDYRCELGKTLDLGERRGEGVDHRRDRPRRRPRPHVPDPDYLAAQGLEAVSYHDVVLVEERVPQGSRPFRRAPLPRSRCSRGSSRL